MKIRQNLRRPTLIFMLIIGNIFHELHLKVYFFRRWLLCRYVPKTAGVTWKPNVPLLQAWKFLSFFVDGLNEISIWIDKQTANYFNSTS